MNRTMYMDNTETRVEPLRLSHTFCVGASCPLETIISSECGTYTTECGHKLNERQTTGTAGHGVPELKCSGKGAEFVNVSPCKRLVHGVKV